MASAVRGWKTFFLVSISSMMFATAGAGAQDSGRAWRDCQTEDADKRISGCTIVINMKGFGSQSKLADALDGRCWAYHLKGMFTQAVVDCKAAISIRPTYSFAYNNLGAAYIGLGEHDAAIQALSKAIELKSNFVWSWANRAKANEAAGHIDAAISDYQRAASLDAGNQSFKQAIASLTNRSEKPAITPDPQANEKISELQRELASMRDGIRRQDEERRRQDEERKRVERDEQVRKEEHEKARLKEEDLKKQIEHLKKLAESQPISKGPEPGYSMPSGKRVAFVVGINRYSRLDPGRQLGTALNDAELIAQTLKQLGFAVIEGRDVTRSEFNQKWQEFLNEVEPGGVAAFYFAGHGVQVGGMNYLLASDTPSAEAAQESLLRKENLDFIDLRDELHQRQPSFSLFILDACRNNPYRGAGGTRLRSIAETRGLARVDATRGTFIMYSADAGETALDRLPGEPSEGSNSLYTRRLAPLLAASDIPLQSVALKVRSDVRALAAKAGHEQTPAYYDGLIGSVCLAGTCGGVKRAESKK